jgi:transposase
MAITNSAGLPISLLITSATPHEVKLVKESLSSRFVNKLPRWLIGDRAYDSDSLDKSLEKQGIEMISPHKRNRRIDTKTQDGRPLRRYKRRWVVERFFAWLQNYRRTVVRYERHLENFTGFVQLAAAAILMKKYF